MSRIQDEPWYKRNNGEYEMKPYMWATLPVHPHPVELISRPWQEEDGTWMINVRMIPGDPTTMVTVRARMVGCFPPSSHEWSYRPKRQIGDDPNAFVFDDNGVFGKKENPRTKLNVVLQDCETGEILPMNVTDGLDVTKRYKVFIQSVSANKPFDSHGGEHVRKDGTDC